MENLNSQIRGKCGGCINPDVFQLRIAIRNITVDKILIHYEKSNCENDKDNYLFNLTSNDRVYINNVYI